MRDTIMSLVVALAISMAIPLGVQAASPHQVDQAGLDPTAQSRIWTVDLHRYGRRSDLPLAPQRFMGVNADFELRRQPSGLP